MLAKCLRLLTGHVSCSCKYAKKAAQRMCSFELSVERVHLLLAINQAIHAHETNTTTMMMMMPTTTTMTHTNLCGG